MIDPAAFRRAFPGDAVTSTWHAPDGREHRRADWPIVGACARAAIDDFLDRHAA